MHLTCRSRSTDRYQFSELEVGVCGDCRWRWHGDGLLKRNPENHARTHLKNSSTQQSKAECARENDKSNDEEQEASSHG